MESLSEDEHRALFDEVNRNPAACWLASCTNLGNKRCSKCRVATYCSMVCQNEHWKCHKKNCSSLVAPVKEPVVRAATSVEDILDESSLFRFIGILSNNSSTSIHTKLSTLEQLKRFAFEKINKKMILREKFNIINI